MPIGDIGGRLENLNIANPDLADDPETALAYAESSLEDDDLMDLAEDQRGMAYIQHLVKQMQSLPEGDQWEQWKLLDSDKQNTYKKFGYVPKPYEDTSILRRVTKAAGFVGNLLDPANSVENLASTVMDGLQEASDFTTHAYKFVADELSDSDNSLADLRRSWKATAKGEAYWREGEREKILGNYDSKYHDLVTDMASGMTEGEFVNKRLGIDRTDPRWDQEILKIHGQMLDPKVNEAIVKLTNAKVSPGRDLANLAGSQPWILSPLIGAAEAIRGDAGGEDPFISRNRKVAAGIPLIGGRTSYELLSGSVDATWRIVMDPTLGAGKINKAYRVGKYAINGVSKIDMVNDIEKMRAAYHAAKAGEKAPGLAGALGLSGAGRAGIAAERIAFHFKNGSIDQLIREMPGIQHAIRDMEAFHHSGRAITGYKGMDEVDGVFDFFTTGAGIETISSGRYGTRAFNSASRHALPMASSRRVPVGALKGRTEKVIDVGRFGGAGFEETMTKLALDNSTPLAKRIGATAALGVWQPVRITAEGIHHMTNMIPKDTFINPNKPESVEIFRQILAFHMPKGFRDDMLNQFVMGGNLSFKKMLSDRVLVENAHAAGLMSHPKGQNFIQRFVARGNHSYAAMNLDKRILPNGEEVRAGIYPTQWSNAWAVPAYRKQLEAARNMGHMAEMTQNGVDFMMSQIWKPSVLLRVGFIPRAFGEELIWSMAQYGSKMNLKGHALLMAAKDSGTPFPIMRPVLGMTRGLARFAPGITKYPLSGLDAITQFTFKQMSRGTRGIAKMFTDEEAFSGLRHMAEHQGALGTATAETISATNMTGLASEYVDDSNLITIMKPDGSGGFERVVASMGAPELVNDPVKELGGLNRIIHKMEDLMEHDPGRIMVDAIARRLKPAEIDEALQSAYRLGLIDNLDDFDSLRALVPDDMPPEWDDYLVRIGDTPVVEKKVREVLIRARQRSETRLSPLDPETATAREYETITARPPVEEPLPTMDDYLAMESDEIASDFDYVTREMADADLEGRPITDAGGAARPVFDDIEEFEDAMRVRFAELGITGEDEVMEALDEFYASRGINPETYTQTQLDQLSGWFHTAGQDTEINLAAHSDEWWVADEDPWAGPTFSDEDALDDELRRLISGETPDDGIIAADDFTMDDEIAVARLNLSAREMPDRAIAEAEANQILDYIHSLPENYRRSLFGRHGAFDRHVRSQGLADRKLVDPNWLNDDQLEDLAATLGRAIDETPGLQAFDDTENFLGELGTGSDTLQSLIKGALNQGVDEAALAKHLKALYAKWAREGYQGILHPTGKKATLWGNNGVAVRGVVARGERDLLNRYYRAMREGNAGEMNAALKEAVASRYGRGDMESMLQGADVATGLKNGTPLATPVRDGFNRVYTIVVPNTTAGAHPGFIPDPNMANTDAAYLAMSGQQAVDLGMAGAPDQAWFTADYQQVKRLKEEMGARGDATPSIGFVDIPLQEFNEGRALARTNLAGGLDPEADVRQLATVFLKRPDRAFDIQGIPGQGMELTPAGRHAQAARAELDELSRVKDTFVDEFEQDIQRMREEVAETHSMEFLNEQQRTARIAGLEERITNRRQGLDEILSGQRVTDVGGPQLREITARLDNPTPHPGNISVEASFNPNEQVYILWDDEGNIIGGAVVKLKNADADSIPAIVVDAAHRGKGNADRLYAAIDDEFGKGTAKRITGKTGYTNQGAAYQIGTTNKRIKEIEQELADTILTPGVDRGEVLEELADTNLADVFNTFSNPLDDSDPRDLRHLAYELNKTGKVSWDSMDSTEIGHLPKNMSLPRLLIQDQASWLNRFTNKRFDEIGRAGNAIIRHPLFAALYVDALKGMGALRDSLIDPKLMNQLDNLAGKYGFQRNEMVDAWTRLPDEVRYSADPVSVARRLNVNLPQQVREISPDDAQKLNQALSHTKYVEKHISDVAMERATRHMTPYLDDHRLRSQFQERHRHLIPFQFAEEQFLKRWGRTIMDNPEVLQKAQLTYMGIKHVGYITQNEYGEDIYEFPGSELFMKAISRAVQTITRQPMMLPMGNPFTGQVKYTFAGSDRFGIPSVGPMMGIAFSTVQRFFPEIAETEFVSGAKEAIYGERGNNRTVAQQIMPTTLYNMYNSLISDPESDPQMASAMMNAAAMMEANEDEHFEKTGEHLVPPADATDHEKDQYQLRLKNHARMVLFARGAMGFFTPASPVYKVEADMSPRYKELLRDMPIEDATRIFLLENPDGMPWTVFDTKSVSGAPLPATDKAYKVLNDNEEYFQKYQMAGPWFLPPSQEDDDFSRQAYYQQMRQNMRIRKLPEEYQSDIAFAQAAPLYFAEKEKKDLALEAWRAAGDSEMVREISATWSQWKEEYFEMNPLFASELNRPDGQERRRKVLDQMTEAVNDPDAPNVPHLIPMKDLLHEYQAMQGALAAWKPYNTAEARATKDLIRENFKQWATHFVRYNPEIKPFYNRVIEYEVGGD